MFNKILVFLGLALAAILSVENMVVGYSSYIFISIGSTGFLVILSTLIGIGIGYGLRGMQENPKEDNDDFDF